MTFSLALLIVGLAAVLAWFVINLLNVARESESDEETRKREDWRSGYGKKDKNAS